MSDNNQNTPLGELYHTTIKPSLQWLYSFLKKVSIKIYLFVKNLTHREKLIYKHYNSYQKGSLLHTSEEYVGYQNAVFQNRFAGLFFKILMFLYRRYLFPKENNTEYVTTDLFLQLITHPQNYVVLTKQKYQEVIQEEVSKIINQKTDEIRQSFIEQLLPFMSDEEAGESNDFFAQKDANRMQHYIQRKKVDDLKERERKIELKEDKLELHEEKLGVKEEKIELQKVKLEIQEIRLDNERKLFAIEMQNRDMEHKIKMLELMNMSLDLQQKTNDIELFKKQFEIMQNINDLEMKERQSSISFGQQMLQLKEQGLDNQLALKQAEFLHNQTKNDYLKLDIENKLLQLRDGEFSQKTKEALLQIEEKKLDLKSEKYNLTLKERSIERRIEEQKIDLMKEQAAMERKSLKMAQEQESMIYKLQNAKLDTHHLSLENNRLIQELRKKPTYIDWTNVG